MRFANAPVSYGVFGDLTVDGATTTDALLQAMSAAGYDGSELGPPGFFGSPAAAAASFRAAGLGAAGAYVPLHTQGDPKTLERDLARMETTLSELAAVDGSGLVILADEGDEALLRAPRKDPVLSLDADGWDRLVRVVDAAAARARDRGLQVSFHPHIATYVELPDEIERLLETIDVALTYDVGHVVLAGGDAVGDFLAWRERINHIHVKDVRRDELEAARADGRADFDTWWARVCTPLGAGDADLSAFATAVRDSGYDAWVVVEQDRAPLTADSVPAVFADQAANLAWVHTAFAPPPD
ncbi:sugar phosphate isomerase/epimerase family protein [Microbacterium sp.]|uniref:sugar phosphate isomerase/epimerase family protein n=1 Tax=Microbacterium sp. TaxID=51671 RepID=UPI003A8359AE